MGNDDFDRVIVFPHLEGTQLKGSLTSEDHIKELASPTAKSSESAFFLLSCLPAPTSREKFAIVNG